MNDPVDIDALHDAIKASLAAKFTDCAVEFYDRPGERIQTPAILLELEEITVPDPDDTGTEQIPVTLMFNAYAVLDYKSGKKQAVKTLAASMMAFIRGQRWGQKVGAASVLGAFPDVVRGKEEAYEVMRVEFSHEALLGLDVWRLDHEGEDGEPLPEAEEASVSEQGENHEKIYPCGCEEP